MTSLQLSNTSVCVNIWKAAGLDEVDVPQERNFQCFLCSDKFAVASDLATHIKNHDVQKAFRCGFCDERFHENSELLAHILAKHEGIPELYNCGICKLTFQVLVTLEEHIAGCKRNATRSSYSNSGNVKGKTLGEEDGSNQGLCVTAKECLGPLSSDTDNKFSHDIQSALHSEFHTNLLQKNTKDQEDQEDGDEFYESVFELTSKNLNRQCEVSLQDILPLVTKNSSDGTQSISLNELKDTGSDNYKCEICSKSCENLELLKLHMCSHNLDRYFSISCVKCDRFFDSMDLLEQHLTNTLCVGWKCQSCHKTFALEASLLKHVALDHKLKLGSDKKCSKCCKRFVLAEDCANHEATHAKSLPFVCKLCNKHFRSLRAVQIYHLPFAHKLDFRLVSATNINLPERSAQSFLETKDTGRPQQKYHTSKKRKSSMKQPTHDLSNEQLSLSAEGGKLECKVCSQQCSNQKSLKEHIQSHAVEECYSVQCVKCNNHFDNHVLLENHLKSKACSGLKCLKCHQSFGLEVQLIRHTVLSHKQDSDMDCTCSECGKTYPSRYSWARHEARHAKSHPYLCKLCGKYFNDLECVLRYHLSSNHGVIKYKRVKKADNCASEESITGTDIECNETNQRRFLKESLAKKLRERNTQLSLTLKIEVADVKKWECNICMQHFNSEEELNEHVSSHASDDCYKVQCVICHDYFDNVGLLENHLESTDCSGFKCLICCQSFGLETQLIKHAILTHKQRSVTDYICSECGKICSKRSAWARHEATHAKSRPFICKICGTCFKTLDHILNYHLPTAHKICRNKQNEKFTAGYVSKEPSSQMDDEHCETNETPLCKTRPNTNPNPNDDSKVKMNSLKILPNKQSKKERAPKMRVCIDCDICGGKVLDEQSLLSHRSYHFMTGKFTIQCSGCSENFSEMENLISHVEQKECSRYKCEDCKQVFPTELSFAIHNFKSHTVAHPSGCYKCLECKETFESLTAYVEHAAEHVFSKPFQCKICNATFISEILMEKHLEETHTLIKNDQWSNNFKCAQCLESFKTKMGIRVHRMFHMQRHILSENKQDPDKPDSSFASYMTSSFCQICSVGFGTASHLDRHEQMHSAVENKPKCTICGMIFKRKGSLKAHMGHHNKPFLCTECGKTFSSSQTLKQHSLANHSAVNPYQCNVCHKFYSSSGTLQHHMKGHTGDRRFECKTCGKKFRDSTCLESHILIHSTEKRFKCKQCNYRARHRAVMARHMDIHNGVKRYTCTYCGKAFRQHSGMKAHLTIHTGEKRYECEHCGKTFARRDYLNVHKLTHTKEKPLSCPICGDRFAVRSNLNVHVRKVHGEENFKHLKEQKARSRQLMLFTSPDEETGAGDDTTSKTYSYTDEPGALQPDSAAVGTSPDTSDVCPQPYPPPAYSLENDSGHSVYQQSQQPQHMFFW